MFIPEIINITIPPNGDIKSKIAIIGSFSNGFDVKAKKPFSGPGGIILESCLHNANLIRGEVYATNLIKENVLNKNKYFNEKKRTFTEEGMLYVHMLQAELQEIEANIFIASGTAAFVALCSLTHLSIYRGYIFPSTLCKGKKVIPIHDPSQANYGNYTYRYLIAADLKKAKKESKYADLIRPERKLVYKYNNVEEVLQYLEYYKGQKQVGFDIEVINFEVACISFSSEPELACAISFDDWNLEEEIQIWRSIQEILGNPESIKIVQNGMFDIPFLLDRNGIIVRGKIHDTMIVHSIMYPELNKSLGFLGSIYCGAQEYWKDTVKFKNIKEDS